MEQILIITLLLLLIFNPETCTCFAQEVKIKGTLAQQKEEMTYLDDYRQSHDMIPDWSMTYLVKE